MKQKEFSRIKVGTILVDISDDEESESGLVIGVANLDYKTKVVNVLDQKGNMNEFCICLSNIHLKII